MESVALTEAAGDAGPGAQRIAGPARWLSKTLIAGAERRREAGRVEERRREARPGITVGAASAAFLVWWERPSLVGETIAELKSIKPKL